MAEGTAEANSVRPRFYVTEETSENKRIHKRLKGESR